MFFTYLAIHCEAFDQGHCEAPDVRTAREGGRVVRRTEPRPRPAGPPLPGRRSMRVVISGGAGFVGSTLALAWKRDHASDDVLSIDNLQRRASELTERLGDEVEGRERAERGVRGLHHNAPGGARGARGIHHNALGGARGARGIHHNALGAPGQSWNFL